MGTISNAGLYTAPAVPPYAEHGDGTAASLAGPSRSGTASVTIVNPAPVVSSISPATVERRKREHDADGDGDGFLCAIGGGVGGHGAGDDVLVNATQLTAVVPAAQLANAGSLAVAVATPAPGAGPRAR